MNQPQSNRSTSAHGLDLLSPAPMPSGTPLTLSTVTTAAEPFATTPTISTAVNPTPSNDPNLRRQPTPLPSRVPVETTKISKTQDSNNPAWKMLNQYRVIRLLGRGTHGTVKYGEDMSKEDPHDPDFAVVSMRARPLSAGDPTPILHFFFALFPLLVSHDQHHEVDSLTLSFYSMSSYRPSKLSKECPIDENSLGLMAGTEPIQH
jgi:hypothetical protein